MNRTTLYPAELSRLSFRTTKVRFPERCVCCSDPPQTTVHIVGMSRRAWIGLSTLTATGILTMALYALANERPFDAALGAFNIVGLLSLSYLLFYWVLLVPALALHRYLRRTRGAVGAILGALPAGVLWLCMAAYGPTAADGDDTMQTVGLFTGLFLTALFVVHVNSQLHLYFPCCFACRKSAAESVRIKDYFPLQRRVELQLRNGDYASSFAQINRGGA